MKAWVLVFALLCGMTTGAARAAETGGVPFEDKARVAGTDLVLNGTGLRTRAFFKIYALGLYLPEKVSTAEHALNQKGPKRIHLVTLRELTAQQFSDALAEGIAKNSSESEQAALRDRLEIFRNTLLALGAADKGALIQLDFLPATGTRLSFKGAVQGKDIPGEDFYRALLKIWLGEHPAQGDLKQALLGKN